MRLFTSRRPLRRALVPCLLAAALPCSLVAQSSAAPAAQRPSSRELHDAAGEIASAPGPLDSSLSPSLTHANIRHVMKMVADWELLHFEPKFTQDWTYVPLYSGLLATSRTLKNRKYHDAVLATAERFGWQLLQGRDDHADDQAIGQAYEELYAEHRDPIRIAAVRENFARVMARQDDPAKDLWWWCDALYMAPPSLAMLTHLTGDRSYETFMQHEWSLTQAHLYNPGERLFFRDATFFAKTEANGKPLFWSRGNGWVLAGTAHVLASLPRDDPGRPALEKLFRDMAERVAELQPADGLWRMGLLDPGAYPNGEVSGTGFFTFAMAWGVNNHLLPEARFRPVIEKAWAGMLRHVYTDGRLGSIQPIGAAPGELQPGSTWAYGVGAFLLAGAELDKGLTPGPRRGKATPR
ncbi:MAG TPA: glycoside hydrolase family 88 protein [Acidobacteriaceae bacterium]|nr:glycoside hydrolase family 88 protein [Acidobacteriaceae bacterium]